MPSFIYCVASGPRPLPIQTRTYKLARRTLPYMRTDIHDRCILVLSVWLIVIAHSGKDVIQTIGLRGGPFEIALCCIFIAIASENATAGSCT